MSPRVLAGRARAECRPARSPAPGRRSARRLRWFGCLVARCPEPRRRPTEEMRQCALAHIGVTGRSREASGSATVAGESAVTSYSLGGSDHRDWLSTHSAVRRAIVLVFRRIFKRGGGARGIPQRATSSMGAGGRGRAQVALARRGEVAKARAGAGCLDLGAPRGHLPTGFLEQRPNSAT